MKAKADGREVRFADQRSNKWCQQILGKGRDDSGEGGAYSTPTAISITFPRRMNCLKPASMRALLMNSWSPYGCPRD